MRYLNATTIADNSLELRALILTARTFPVTFRPEYTLTEQTVSCPYCGESILIFVDDSLPSQRYIEDCQVCCRPIELDVSVMPDGNVAVVATTDSS